MAVSLDCARTHTWHLLGRLDGVVSRFASVSFMAHADRDVTWTDGRLRFAWDLGEWARRALFGCSLYAFFMP